MNKKRYVLMMFLFILSYGDTLYEFLNDKRLNVDEMVKEFSVDKSSVDNLNKRIRVGTDSIVGSYADISITKEYIIPQSIFFIMIVGYI